MYGFRGSIAVWAVLAQCASGQTLLSYEGNVLPELDGWSMGAASPGEGAYTRTIENGLFVTETPPRGLDRDDYTRTLTAPSDNLFFEWSSQVCDNSGVSFFQVYICGIAYYSYFELSYDSEDLYAYLEPGGQFLPSVRAKIAPGTMHTYRVEADGSLYTVFADGQPLVSRQLQHAEGLDLALTFGVGHPFGECPSRVEWDYIRVGMIPEPATALLILACLGATACRRTHRIR